MPNLPKAKIAVIGDDLARNNSCVEKPVNPL